MSTSKLIGPIIVGATGGSGTRVIAEILMAAGIHMGHDLNGANDSRSTQQFLRSWAKRYIAADYGAKLSQSDVHAMQHTLAEAMGHQKQGLTSDHLGWGWKNPPNIFLIDAYLRLISTGQFIHLVRDGRDMAFSGNSGQLNKFGDVVLSESERSFPEWQQKLLLWAKSNLHAAVIGEAAGADRYLRLRFEDLTSGDATALASLIDFVGVPNDCLEAAQSLIHRPASVGRWHRQSEAIEALNNPMTDEALQLLGYR